MLGLGLHPTLLGITHEDARDALRQFRGEFDNRIAARRRRGDGEDSDPLNWPAREDGMAYDGAEIDNFMAQGITMFTAPNPRGTQVGRPHRDRDDVDRREPDEEGRANLIDLNRPPPIPERDMQDRQTGIITFRPQMPGARGPQINQMHDGPPPDAADQYHQANNEGPMGGEL